MLIRLQCIYNFWLFHAVILSFLDVLQSFYSNFIPFLVLTYWHSAQCQLLFFACFLHRKKSIPNEVQTQRNFLENFSGPEDTWWAKEVLEGGSEGNTTHQGAWYVSNVPIFFCLFHVVILSFFDVLQSFYSNFISFLLTNLLT